MIDNVDQDRINRILENPSESTNLELKTWLNLDEDFNQCKVLKAILALRNADGGYLIIGFDDESCAPDEERRNEAIEQQYETEMVQELVSRHAGEPFEITIVKGELNGKRYPVIIVPNGIEAPVLCKRGIDCQEPHKKQSLKKNVLYVRTFGANNKISSAQASSQQDLNNVVKLCFDNREADIGRFLRRHLTGLSFENLLHLLNKTANTPPHNTLRQLANNLIEDSQKSFPQAVADSSLSREQKQSLLESSSYEVSLIFSHEQGYNLPTCDYLNVVLSGNPHYSVWPVWLDARRARKPSEQPRVIQGQWQALLESHDFDFMIFDPQKGLYLRRILEDDLHSDRVEPKKCLDPELVILRVAEVFLVSLSIAASLRMPSDTVLGLDFRWYQLKGRSLAYWANPKRLGSFYGKSKTDDSLPAFVEMPIDNPRNAISPYVQSAVNPLFACFDGWQPPINFIESLINNLLDRSSL